MRQVKVRRLGSRIPGPVMRPAFTSLPPGKAGSPHIAHAVNRHLITFPFWTPPISVLSHPPRINMGDLACGQCPAEILGHNWSKPQVFLSPTGSTLINSVVSNLWQTKVRVILRSFVVLTWMCDTISADYIIELVYN